MSEDGEATPGKQGLRSPWQPGQSGNPNGRPKGARNKLGEAFLEDIYTRWQEKGMAVIDQVIAERPHEFLKVVAGILPKELKVTNESDLTDEQLIERIRQLDTVIRPFLFADGEDRAGDGAKPKGLPN